MFKITNRLNILYKGLCGGLAIALLLLIIAYVCFDNECSVPIFLDTHGMNHYLAIISFASTKSGYCNISPKCIILYDQSKHSMPIINVMAHNRSLDLIYDHKISGFKLIVLHWVNRNINPISFGIAPDNVYIINADRYLYCHDIIDCPHLTTLDLHDNESNTISHYIVY